MIEKTHHVSEKKKQIAKNIQKLVVDYPIIAAVDMENLPTPQLQQMKSQLRGKIELTMTKRRIIKHAIEEIKDKKKNIEQLEPHLKGMPALIFTKENPFSLFKILKKSKTSAPAKAGQTAPFDLKIPKGPTSFAPGPVIGELAQLGIKAGVEGGKVVIKEDSTVVKEGEKISAKAAEILTRLGVEPMEVGLNVTAVYENGDIFTANILDIDEEKFMADLQKAGAWAFNLAVSSAYTTKETINVLIGKAFNDAKAIGLSQGIIDGGIIEGLLSKAEKFAVSLKSTAKVAIAEKPKEEPKVEEKKPEEKPKEDVEAEEKKPEPKKEEVPPPKEEEKVEEISKQSFESLSNKFDKKPKEEVKIEVKEVPVPKVKEEPKPIEKKEEKILEEEKKIVEEEKRLEKEAEKPKIEAPVEKEVEKEVKEEEEKQLEKERIEKEKEFEKVEEKKEEVKIEEKQPEEVPKVEDKTDKKIAEMVAKTKKFVKGEIPDTEKLIEEAGKLTAKEIKKEEPEKKPEEKKEEIPTSTIEEKKPEPKEEPKVEEKKEEKDIEKKKKEQKEVEDLAQELIRKGTLRK